MTPATFESLVLAGRSAMVSARFSAVHCSDSSSFCNHTVVELPLVSDGVKDNTHKSLTSTAGPVVSCYGIVICSRCGRQNFVFHLQVERRKHISVKVILCWK